MAVLVATIFVANVLAIVIERDAATFMAEKNTPETLLGSVRYLSPRQSVSEEKSRTG